jgi:tRNA-splicing ligase RtcB
MTQIPLNRIDETTWEIPKHGAMRVPGRIIADERLIQPILHDKAADQVVNVACLPGIVNYSMAMPDAHWGYGFPIGGVAATDPDAGGVISPGGVGYDINCGCRVMTTSLKYEEIKPRLREVINTLYRDIPCGVGSQGAIPQLDTGTLKQVLRKGALWAVEQGYGSPADLEATESYGCIEDADPETLSARAIERGRDQVGTLGSGNHFAEVGVVEKIHDPAVAEAYGLVEGNVTVMIHSGSRGLGYQVCDDFIQVMIRAAQKYGITLPDRQLCCAPVKSEEGRRYFGAMSAAANYAWANRQIMMELARRAVQHALKISRDELGANLLYDVCHNIAKMELHDVGGVSRVLCVHRKGATRAFPGSRPEVVERYKHVGQPVLIPGDMGTGSYVCAGTEEALRKSFGSCCHGAGRVMSRKAASKMKSAHELVDELESRGIIIFARSKKTITEEAPYAYKDIDAVAEVCDMAGIGRRVARIRPVGVVKG